MQMERDEALNSIKGKELEITRLMQSNKSLRTELVDKESTLTKQKNLKEHEYQIENTRNHLQYQKEQFTQKQDQQDLYSQSRLGGNAEQSRSASNLHSKD